MMQLLSSTHARFRHKTIEALVVLCSICFCAPLTLADIANPFSGSKYQDFNDIQVPHLHLQMEPDALAQLIGKRNQALEQNILESSGDDYVSGKIIYNDKKVKVKLRLKGDYVEHLKEDKWSFRVKVRGDNALFGMKVFSLQHPKMRLFTHEWTILQALKQEGLISLRYDYVKLSINDQYLGLFNIEEHFEKRLVENNQRREGPVFKFDETELFRLINQDIYDGGKHDNNLFYSAAILSFQKSKTEENPLLAEQFLKAKYLLEAFRNGQARVADVFNIEQLAKYYAISDVFMGKHGNRWHNQRFYFNPIDSRIEPIGFDFNDDKPGLDPLARINNHRGLFYGTNWAFDVFSRMIFSDPAFFKEYQKQAERITRPEYLTAFFEKIEPEAKAHEAILMKEFDTDEFRKYVQFNENFKQTYFDNQKYVRNSLKKTMTLKAHLKNLGNDFFEIVLNNRGQHPLEIVGYQLNNRMVDFETPIILNTFRYGHKYKGSTYNLYNLKVKTPADPHGASILIRYRTLGLSNLATTPIIDNEPAPSAPPPYILPKTIDAGHPMRRHANAESFHFIKRQGNTLEFLPGSWTVNRTLIIPPGVIAKISAGTTLNLIDNASLISRSPLNALGTSENPIVFTSSDASGGGIFVANAGNKSTWKHVSIDHLAPPSYREWRPTGAVTFYKSPISLKNVAFKSNSAEDSLNVINTDFSIEEAYFYGSTSDAFDSDFCTGILKDSIFENIGNDAVDVSGTTLQIYGLTVNRAGDKGISAGERSTVSAQDVRVSNATTGAASKDQSELKITRGRFNDNTIGLVVYQKKPEYGPSTIRTKGISMHATDLTTLIEPGSSIFIDNIKVQDLPRKKQKIIFDSLKDGRNLN